MDLDKNLLFSINCLEFFFYVSEIKNENEEALMNAVFKIIRITGNYFIIP